MQLNWTKRILYPIMTIFINIDQFFIQNYSQKVTCCHFDVKKGQKMMKFGWVAHFGTGNSIIEFISNH